MILKLKISGNGTLQAALANVAPPRWNVLLVCTGTPQIVAAIGENS